MTIWARRIAWLFVVLALAFVVIPFQARRDEGRVRTKWCAPAGVVWLGQGLCGDEGRRRAQGAAVVVAAASVGVLFTRRPRRVAPTVALGLSLASITWSSIPYTTAESGNWRASCPPAVVSYPRYQEFDGLMTECYRGAGTRLLTSGGLLAVGSLVAIADYTVVVAARVVRRSQSDQSRAVS